MASVFSRSDLAARIRREVEGSLLRVKDGSTLGIDEAIESR
jgi:hypothetical protein